MRLERVDVPGGAELITVFAKLGGIESTENDKWIPLVSILRDTLGDNNAENNRLRYVWPLTYTRPTMKQRLAAAMREKFGGDSMGEMKRNFEGYREQLRGY